MWEQKPSQIMCLTDLGPVRFVLANLRQTNYSDNSCTLSFFHSLV